MAAGIGVGILIDPARRLGLRGRPALVPQALREASATAWAPARSPPSIRVVLPAAVSGLVAAFILAVSRAIGETMVVFIAGGAGGGALFSANPLEPGLTMTAAMAIAGQPAPTPWSARRSPSRASSSSGSVLFLITFALNVIAARFVRRVRVSY